MTEQHKQPVPEITNFAEAKAYKHYLDHGQLGSVATAEAMSTLHKERAAAQQADLARQEELMAQNPDAITGIPEHLKTSE